MTTQRLRVGLIGVGGICAGVHYPGLSLNPDVEIAGICEPNDALRGQRQQNGASPRPTPTVRPFFTKSSPTPW